MRKTTIYLAMAIILTGIFLSATAYSMPAYITGNSEPWSVTSNLDAMNTAFGTGNWDKLTFTNAMSTGLLSGIYDFIYIDGGARSTAGFTGFVNTNQAALEDWVSKGGSLFLNAARWSDYSDFYMGFDVTLHHDISCIGSAIDPAHTIFTGPNDAGTSWTGNGFGHDSVTGTDLTYLISGHNKYGSYVGDVLGEKDYGLGHLMVGGMTSTFWHNPDPYADNLRANILNYGADCAAIPTAEPASLLLMGTGLMGFGGRIIVKRRKKKDC